MMYRTAVGPQPVLTDPSTWAPAWALEEARADVTEKLAHATFRGIDPARPANPFAKQITAMPHARVPSLDDRASSITVVRVALRIPAQVPWLARRSMACRATRMLCHAPVRTGGAVGAGWDLD